MQSKKYHTHVMLDDRQHRLLVLLARKDRISKAEVIRRLLDERALNETDYKNNPFMKLGTYGTKTGIINGSSNHDSYLYGKGSND